MYLRRYAGDVAALGDSVKLGVGYKPRPPRRL